MMQTVFSTRTFQSSFAMGSLNISTFISSGAVLTTTPGIEVKLVIIPPAVKMSGVDHSDYQAVEMVYGLEK